MGVFNNLFKKDKKEDKNNNQTKANFIDDEWVEVTAGSREEAIDRAANALNSTESHLEIQWLSKDGKKLRARKSTETVEKSSKGNVTEEKETVELQSYDASDREESSYQEEYEEEVEEETDLGRKAKDLLSEMIKCIDEPSSVELYETNKTIRLEIESQESGLFIGKHGQTLEAIQHLMMKMMMKDELGKFLVIDAEDYRIRREESLETKARKLAKKARKEKRPIGVEPMNAIDRRIVHVALKGEPGVETKSIGEGANRRVLIVPKGYQQRGRNSGRRNNNNNRYGRSQQNEGNYRREKEYEGPSRGSDDSYDDVDGY
ncbi:MAG: KH domain-containing protein [Bdellovibrionales bacterium]|nr:KH domain-containing protein [Bdellovibrionales bacterium]